MKKVPIPHLCVLAILFGLCLPVSVLARKVEHWSYDRLFEEADLVVIARAASSVASKDEWEEDLFKSDRFQGQETTFKAAATLKGKSGDVFKLLHFRFKGGAQLMNDGPGLVSFLTAETEVQLEFDVRQKDGEVKELKELRQSLVGAPEYLLFLKKREDGRFEAVSGQVDPAFSVRALFGPEVLQ